MNIYNLKFVCQNDQFSRCCTCPGTGGSSGTTGSLPLICLVPRGQEHNAARTATPRTTAGASSAVKSDFQLLDEEYIRKNFKLPQRALYLDPFRY